MKIAFLILGRLQQDWFWEMGSDLRFSFMSADFTENAPEFYIGKTRRELDLGENYPKPT